MARFDDLLSSLGTGEDGISVAYPDTFGDDIRSAYDEDMSIPTAKIQVLESENAELLAQVATLKAHNYDLLMQIPAAPSEEISDEGGDNDSDSDSEDEPDNLDKVFSD
jgi:hypothetical protein